LANHKKERNAILNCDWPIRLRHTVLRFCMCHGLYGRQTILILIMNNEDYE